MAGTYPGTVVVAVDANSGAISLTCQKLGVTLAFETTLPSGSEGGVEWQPSSGEVLDPSGWAYPPGMPWFQTSLSSLPLSAVLSEGAVVGYVSVSNIDVPFVLNCPTGSVTGQIGDSPPHYEAQCGPFTMDSDVTITITAP